MEKTNLQTTVKELEEFLSANYRKTASARPSAKRSI